MITRILTKPTADQEPISLEEAKSHLRVDFPDDDAYIQALITVAREYAEGFQGRSLAQVDIELILDGFPRRLLMASSGRYSSGYSTPIRLPRTPILSVSSVSYTLADGTVRTLPTTDYIVKADGDIIPGYEKWWPVDILIPGDSVKVSYSAGYTPATVPATTKQALLILIANWYENREPIIVGKSITSVPISVEALLWMDRSW